MKREAQRRDSVLTIETPKQIRDGIIKELNREIRRRHRELEDDVFRLQDALRSRN